MPIILFVNLKGGVAKTTTAVAIAECLASRGARTLLIDADHQSMAGELLLGELRYLRAEQQRLTLHDLLATMLEEEKIEPALFERYIVPKVSNIGHGIETLSCLPCSIRIDDFQTNMAKARKGFQSPDDFMKLWQSGRAALKTFLAERYDYTLIDCPPSLAPQIKFLLGIADFFAVPCVPDHLSVRGALYLMGRLKQLDFNVTPLGTLWTLVRAQNFTHTRIIGQAAKGQRPYSELPIPFKTIIPNASRIAESAEPNQRYASLTEKYGSASAEVFDSLATEIAKRCERAGKKAA